jgi:cytochrome c oxidase subunit II
MPEPAPGESRISFEPLPAPDLTHLASRRTLAAATWPNTRGHLGGWILDPQAAKPGSLMPPTLLPPDELHALLAYLESLE